MKGYKAFEPGLICKGKQYEENAIATEKRAEPCKCGIHFCESPFDVLDYYPLITDEGKFTDFAEVEALDKPVTDDKKKYCTTKLKVGAKLSFAGFIRACIDFVFEKTVNSMPDDSGYSAKIGSSGDYAKIDSSGEDSVIMCAGFNSRAKAKKGSWITLTEWKHDPNKDRYVPVCVKTEQVDGERIKEDTFYQLIDGEFKEVE